MTSVRDDRSRDGGGRSGWIAYRSVLLVAVVVGVALAAGAAIGENERYLPPSPSGVTASRGTTGTVAVVTWQRATAGSGVVSYRVWRSEDGGEYAPVGGVGSSVATFTDRAGLTGASYRYRVTALDADGAESPPSAVTATVTVGWVLSPHLRPEPAKRNTTRCRACHVSHSSEASALLRADEARSGQIAVCYRCHDGTPGATDVAAGARDSFSLASGHSLEGTASEAADMTNDCGACHELHADASVSPRLRPRAIVRAAVGTRVVSGSVSWCLACHDQAASWFTDKYDDPYPSRATAAVDGQGYPLYGTFPGPAVYLDTARNPHASIAANAEAGRERGDCLYCHAAHRGPSRYDGLRALFRPTSAETLDADRATGAYAALCFMCHGGARPAFLATTPTDIRRYVLSGSRNAGHRVQTAGGRLPVGAALPCYVCHDPHGSAASRFGLAVVAVTGPASATLVGDAPREIVLGADASGVDVRNFCLTCHTTSDTAAGWDGASLRPVESGAAFEGIDRATFDAVLRLPDLKAHEQADIRSCYECHREDYSRADSFNIHNPTYGRPSDATQCDTCHEAAPGAEAGTGGPSGGEGSNASTLSSTAP